MAGRKKKFEEKRRKWQWPNFKNWPRLLRKNMNTAGRMTSLKTASSKQATEYKLNLKALN
jgi:hypothetical protein